MARTDRQHYTLVCRGCQKVIMLTRSPHVPRPVRYGVCTICAPAKRWDYRLAPMRAA